MKMVQRLLPFLVLGLLCASAQATPYPTKPLRLVVPFAAGGNTDIAARLLAQGLSTEFKQPVYVENKAGAGTAVGTEEVARSLADGYTLLFTTVGLAVNLMNPAVPATNVDRAFYRYRNAVLGEFD